MGTACREEGPTLIPPTPAPTATPIATPLPPRPTSPPPGSEANPISFLFAGPQVGDGGSLAASLSEALDGGGQLVVHVNLAEDYAEALAALCDGRAHVVSLPAMGYLAASERGCGQALYVLEQDGATSTQGQLLADARTAVFILEGFRQRTFCRPDAGSINGWIVPSVTLLARGIDPFSELGDVIDAGSDEEVVRMIYGGQCEVGATRFGAEKDVRLAEPEQIVFIESLTPVPNDVVVISSKLDDLTRAMVVDMLSMHADDLAFLLDADALRAADDGTFADLRALFTDAGFNVAALGK